MDFNEKEGEGNLGSLRGGRVGTLGSYQLYRILLSSLILRRFDGSNEEGLKRLLP